MDLLSKDLLDRVDVKGITNSPSEYELSVSGKDLEDVKKVTKTLALTTPLKADYKKEGSLYFAWCKTVKPNLFKLKLENPTGTNK